MEVYPAEENRNAAIAMGMFGSQPATWIRPVPGVPGIYGIKFESQEQELLVMKFSNPNGKQVKVVSDQWDQLFTLEEYFERASEQYGQKYPERKLFSVQNPPVLLEAPPGVPHTTAVTMVLLAEGLAVAYSGHFVATFSRDYARWFLNGVGVMYGTYLPLDAGFNRKIAADLNWDGDGLQAVEIFLKNGHHAYPPNVPQRLLKPRVVDPAEGFHIRDMWIGPGTNIVHAESTTHVFRFLAGLEDGEFAWTLFHCGDFGDPSLCQVYEMEMQIKHTARVMEVTELVDEQFDLID